jgi:uncharacterized protein involved in oxidation of intracellular sulfur
MKLLFILNGPPYGTERFYNALRLLNALMKKAENTEITVFLMADAVIGAKAGQKTPEGYYSIERMLKRVLTAKGQVLLCGTCMDARGLTDAEIAPGPSAAPWTSLPPRCSRPTRRWCSDWLERKTADNAETLTSAGHLQASQSQYAGTWRVAESLVQYAMKEDSDEFA